MGTHAELARLTRYAATEGNPRRELDTRRGGGKSSAEGEDESGGTHGGGGDGIGGDGVG